MDIKPDCPLPAGSAAWAYLRVSHETSADRGTPIAGQRRVLSQYCSEHNLHLSRVFVDEAKSGGAVAPRRAFNDMIALARRDPRPVDGIILWSWSRFAREQDDAHFFKADLRRRGYTLISLTDNIPAGDFQYIFEALVHWKDAQYLKDLRQAVQRGHHTLAALGYSPGGFPPRGYKTAYEEVVIEGKKRKARRWVQDPATWDRVRHAWRMRAEGATYKEIHAATLLFRNHHSYSDLFKNRHYLGVLCWGDTEVTGAIPAAIDQTTWDAVQARRRHHRNPRRVNSPHLLSGLACCAHCGRPLSGITQKAGGFRLSNGKRLKITGSRSRYYRCELAHKQRDQCPGIGYPRAEPLERAVLEAVSTRVLTPAHLTDMLSTHAIDDLARIADQRILLETQKRETDATISRLVNAIEKQGWSPALSDRLSQRELERETLHAKLAALNDQAALYIRFMADGTTELHFDHDALAVLCNALVDDLQTGDPQETRLLLQQFITRIDISPDTATIYYTFPLWPEPGIVYSQYPRSSSDYTPYPLTQQLTVAWKT